MNRNRKIAYGLICLVVLMHLLFWFFVLNKARADELSPLEAFLAMPRSQTAGTGVALGEPALVVPPGTLPAGMGAKIEMKPGTLDERALRVAEDMARERIALGKEGLTAATTAWERRMAEDMIAEGEALKFAMLKLGKTKAGSRERIVARAELKSTIDAFDGAQGRWGW